MGRIRGFVREYFYFIGNVVVKPFKLLLFFLKDILAVEFIMIFF